MGGRGWRKRWSERVRRLVRLRNCVVIGSESRDRSRSGSPAATDQQWIMSPRMGIKQGLEITYRNPTVGRYASAGNHNDLLRAGNGVGYILQLSPLSIVDLDDGHPERRSRGQLRENRLQRQGL